MMRWVNRWNAMKKGDRQRHYSTTHSLRHQAVNPRSQKLSRERVLDDPDVPEAGI
jgi:hypothetical protein